MKTRWGAGVDQELNSSKREISSLGTLSFLKGETFVGALHGLLQISLWKKTSPSFKGKVQFTKRTLKVAEGASTGAETLTLGDDHLGWS